jgi:hypothetical protein
MHTKGDRSISIDEMHVLRNMQMEQGLARGRTGKGVLQTVRS